MNKLSRSNQRAPGSSSGRSYHDMVEDAEDRIADAWQAIIDRAYLTSTPPARPARAEGKSPSPEPISTGPDW